MVQVIKKPAAKPATAKRATAKKALAPAGRSGQAINLPAVAAVLVEGRRKDLAALTKVGTKSLESLQAVVKHQTEALKAAILEWQSVVKVMAMAGMRESIANLDQLARGAFEMALDNIREIAALAADSQAEAIDVVKQRIAEDVEEVKLMLRRG